MYKETIKIEDMEDEVIYVYPDADLGHFTAKGKIGGKAYAVNTNGYEVERAVDMVKNTLYMIKQGGEELLERARNGDRTVPDLPKENPFKVVHIKNEKT